jgi:ferredoxin-NADP reductase
MPYIELQAVQDKTFLINPYLGMFTFCSLDPNKDVLPKFLPGQYLAFGVGIEQGEGVTGIRETAADKRGIIKYDGMDFVIRRLSIATAPELACDPNNPQIGFYVAMIENGGRRKDRKGVMTNPLFYQPPGTRYIVNTKTSGDFTLPEHSQRRNFTHDDERDRLWIATGTGLGPFMSMLESPSRSNIKTRLVHGVSYHRDLAFKERLEELARDPAMNFEYYHTTSQESCVECLANYVEELFLVREPGITGRVNSGKNAGELETAVNNGMLHDTKLEGILNHNLSPETDLVLICGNPYTIDNLETLLVTGLNFVKGEDTLFDKFWDTDN